MIRHLLAEDIPLILPLVAQVQALHVQHEPTYFQARQSTPDLIAFFTERMEQGQTILIDDRDGRAAGYALFYINQRPANLFSRALRVGHLDQICVDHRFRRQGIGKALITAMRAQLRDSGIEGWTVDYWNFNTASDALMRNCGARSFRTNARGQIGGQIA